MSTVIFQGLQPCLDSQLIETTTLKLKIVEPKSPTPIFPLLEEYTHHPPNKIFLDDEMESFKPFQSLRLSDKSLELCTENLGSESGSDTSEGFDFETEKMLLENQQRNFNYRPLKIMKKSDFPREFPPPLTTISGSNSIQVKPHREAGRLVMKAIRAPANGSYFQAERSHGRLQLSIFKNSEPKFDPVANESLNNQNVFNVEIQEDNEENTENEVHEEEEEYNEFEGENDEYYLREDWNANIKDVGVEMGIEKFQRPSWCKEEGGHGNKGWCGWKTILVVTS